ncbi:MAG: glycosyltransferase [Acidobacteria bacterium]|nr:glycosyltransferase [Acidobacteriota bacterium]
MAQDGENRVLVAFASGSDDLIPTLIERLRELEPSLPLYVVGEFAPPGGRWIPYHPERRFTENWARVRAALRGKRVRFAGIILQPRMPYWRLRLIGLLLSPAGFIAYNENLDHFMLRPRSAGTMLRHCLWRTGNLFRWQLRPGGHAYTFFWRLRRPSAFRRPLLYGLAALAGWLTALAKALLPAAPDPRPGPALPFGVSVVVPSRNGKHLLEKLLPGLERELREIPSEIIVADNGSEDGTAAFLAAAHPRAIMELSAGPLAFAAAANRGLARARFSRTCLLNNDMVLGDGFFAPLLGAFDTVPELFAATAQIFFPEGQRRQETGKAVMPPKVRNLDFPLRCDEPAEGEDRTWVLYGSGGCSLYDTRKARVLGGFDEIFQPAYVEDFDLGYRAWQRGWPTVFAAGAQLVHEHQATTSRYFSAEELSRVLEVNYLKFLARHVASPRLFLRLWHQAIGRLNRIAALQDNPHPWAGLALQAAWRAPGWIAPPPQNCAGEVSFLALGNGNTAVYPCRAASGKPVILVVSPYAPFPLSHGGAVRMYNLMRRAARDFDQVLVCFSDRQDPPPPELRDIAAEIVQVRRAGTHLKRSTERPDVVEEFDAPDFRAALRETVRKWRPAIAQLEFTQSAQFARDCAPARTILVEHDITLDLYEQLLRRNDDWETRRQLERWRRFETAAWREAGCVVTMSEKDRAVVAGARAEVLANGVDLLRFRPAGREPEPGRILFIGSFAHLPNLLAVDFFLREVWPRLADLEPALHIVAGARHRYYLDFYREQVELDLNRPGVEVEDFVSDVRPAYERAAVVVAPLIASAGTNIKIMEAMAMGKAVVSTPAGVNGLDLAWGADVLVTPTGEAMAAAIRELLSDAARRGALERQARATVEARYDWDAIARRQKRIYESLLQP